MKIAILGAGRIGSTFAFHLARAGHDVTVIARGPRLVQLQRDSAIVAEGGARATVTPAAALDPTVAFDLVLVTVLAHQSEVLLPALEASQARTVMFMFNTFELGARRRAFVGSTRTAFAFPTMTVFFVDGKLRSSVKGPGMGTVTDHAEWARRFTEAGLPTKLEPDMDSFLRSHAAFVVPLMAAAMRTWKRDHGLSWAEARDFAQALQEGVALVRRLGHAVTPAMVARLAGLPGWFLTGVIWGFSRLAATRNLGEFGPAEAQHLIDAMAAAAPGQTPRLLAVRPP
jgi:2-dehydropantoate 2-reductase